MVPAPPVAPAPAPRVLPRGGRRPLVVQGLPARPFSDLYHLLMTLTWPRLILSIFLTFVAVNLLFACLYLAGGDVIAQAEPGSLSDAFFFSVQTFATIGYGAMAPKSTWGHVIVSIEAFLGLMTTAMSTGLMFARFSKPTARVLFADVCVVTIRNGVPTLMFRMGNQRANQIVEARLQVAVSRIERTVEGEVMRRFSDIDLVRNQNMLFAMSWTAMHEIGPASPLYGKSIADLQREQAEIIVSLVGLDETMNQTVHARWSYMPAEIRFGHRYIDILEVLPNGHRRMNYSRFHDTEPQAGAEAAALVAGAHAV
jgi:inward rectifier potassium channel